MQLDLQSLEKAPFRTFAWAFAPKMLEIDLPCLRMNRSFLQDLSRAASRLSRGPVAGNHRQHFFDPIGSNTITIVHRINQKRAFCSRLTQLDRKGTDGDFLQLGLREAGNSSG